MRNSTHYILAGPKTFRRSSRKLFDIWGSNLQNLEKSIRQMYYPDGFSPHLAAKCGYWLDCGDTSVFTEEELVSLRVFLQCDESGAEALIVAYECENKDYRTLFKNRIKVHVYVAMKLFIDIWTPKMKEKGGLIEDFNIHEIAALPIKELKKHKYWSELDLLIKDSDNWPLAERYYYLAKQTCHSANYGIEKNTFRMNVLDKSGGKVILTDKQAETFLLVYRSLFPEIPERCRRIEQQVERTKMLYNILGMPYHITDYNVLSTTMKDLYAWSAQSCVGEITRIAFSNLQEYIEAQSRQWDIMADTHDSYLVQCPLGDVKECSQKMQEFMNIPMVSPMDGEKFNMQSEVNVGFNWCNFKKGKNELGLRDLKWL